MTRLSHIEQQQGFVTTPFTAPQLVELIGDGQLFVLSSSGNWEAARPQLGLPATLAHLRETAGRTGCLYRGRRSHSP